MDLGYVAVPKINYTWYAAKDSALVVSVEWTAIPEPELWEYRFDRRFLHTGSLEPIVSATSF